MVSRTIGEMELRRYLLGTLSEEEEAHQEERLLTEDSYFERLVLAEDDLIDDYVRGKLSAEDKERMEQRFLSSAARQERLRIARDLARYTSAKEGLADRERGSDHRHIARDGAIPRIPRSRRRAAIALPAGAALLVIAAAVVLLVWIARLNTRIDAFSQEQTKAQQREADLNKELAGLLQRQEQLSTEIEKEQRQRVQLQEELIDLRRAVPPSQRLPITDLLAWTLTPGRTRDRGEVATLEIPPSTKWVRLKLTLEQGGYTKYRARLQTDEAKQIWTGTDLRPLRTNNDERVDIVFPARLLVPGDYTVLLSPTGGRERIGTYYFTAVRKRQ